MTTRIIDPRIGHWGYWRDDERVLAERSRRGRVRIRIRVHPPTMPPSPPGPSGIPWVRALQEAL